MYVALYFRPVIGWKHVCFLSEGPMKTQHGIFFSHVLLGLCDWQSAAPHRWYSEVAVSVPGEGVISPTT